ncbi:sensor histidine kinase [Paenibacillus sp. GCM10027628]|uniref:sensor histidine kinase n=1 Tax=Paenibacillus sp. GCM10027628 TaxID=3273413 RepID=UPI0036407225
MFFSLRSRLMAVFSILLILPFAALAYILSAEATQIIKASIESSTTQTIEQFASHVSTLLMQVEDTGNQVLSSRATQDWLTVQLNPDHTIQDRVLSKQRLREYFSSYAVNNSNGISISVFTEETGGLWTQDLTYKKSDWFHAYQTANKRWTTAHKDIDQSDEILRSRPVNSLILPLVHLQSLRNAGFIKVNYPTSLLRDAIEKIRVGKTGKVMLLTHEGKSVLNQDISAESEILKGALQQIDDTFGQEASGIFPIQRNGVTNLLFFRKLPAQDWMIVGTVPEGELYEKISQIRQTILFASAVLLVLAMIAAYWLSAGITRPLSVMAKAMKHVKRGEFSQALQFMPKVRRGHSEVDYVSGVFEQMTYRLRYLIETEFETNLRRKNAEYKALLLQINPHFYNNTLEIISGLAAMKREDLVMDATEALGKMMRYSLNLNSDLVRVSEEMAYIRDYLFILQLRHEERLSLMISEDPAAGPLMIAKFILQPLVENAVKYSLEKEGVAQVFLKTQVHEDRLLLTVKDNGIGMTPELVQDLLAEMKKGDSVAILSSEGQSIGLRNVLSRCRLNYGEQFELELQSRLGEGTSITLRLPMLRS